VKNYSPSMVDGVIVRLSVSQLSRFDRRERGGCESKWWYKYVGKIPDPPRVATQEGIDGHKRLEDYFNGQPVVFLDCDVPALQHLPALGTGAQAEVQLEKLSCLRIPFQGSMDLLHGRDVYDYKYQAQIRTYTEPTAQLWGYLEEVRLRDNAGGRLGFHHVYIKKKAPFKAQKVSQYFEPREVERQWATYGSLIAEMQQVAAETNPDKVPKNVSACYAYGPCPYLNVCNRNQQPEEDVMGFLDEIEKAKKELAAVSLPEVNASTKSINAVEAQQYKALPPDAPPPDATPTAPEATLTPPGPVPEAPAVKRRGRPSKADLEARNKVALEETPDGRPPVVYSTKPTPPVLDAVPALKTMRLGLKIGLPEYSSAEAAFEMVGTDEEKMASALENMIMRRLSALLAKFGEALDIKRKAGLVGK
jgi:hypothetical protein